MSAGTLRHAAVRMRHDVEFGQQHGDPGFITAVADWLDFEATTCERADRRGPGVRADVGHLGEVVSEGGVDLRVDLILRVQNDHMVSSCGVETERSAEHWRCRCGESYRGDGALKKGRRHCASEVLSALDEAAMVP